MKTLGQLFGITLGIAAVVIFPLLLIFYVIGFIAMITKN